MTKNSLGEKKSFIPACHLRFYSPELRESLGEKSSRKREAGLPTTAPRTTSDQGLTLQPKRHIRTHGGGCLPDGRQAYVPLAFLQSPGSCAREWCCPGGSTASSVSDAGETGCYMQKDGTRSLALTCTSLKSKCIKDLKVRRDFESARRESRSKCSTHRHRYGHSGQEDVSSSGNKINKGQVGFVTLESFCTARETLTE